VRAARPALAAVLATGCYPTVEGRKSCGLEFRPSKPIVTGRSVLGQVAISCDIPPDRHELRLILEHRAAGVGWTDEAEATSGKIPRKRPATVYQVKAGCRPGAWRAVAHVAGSLRGIEFEFSDRSVTRLVGSDECSG
jgi:hypothetical protein